MSIAETAQFRHELNERTMIVDKQMYLDLRVKVQTQHDEIKRLLDKVLWLENELPASVRGQYDVYIKQALEK